MNAESSLNYFGTGGVRSNSNRWNENNRDVQPTVPFGSSLMKPLYHKTEKDEFRLRREAGKSLERLMSQQNHMFQRSTAQQAATPEDTFILLRDSVAKLYDRRSGRFVQSIHLEKGNLLRQVFAKGEGAAVLRKLRDEYEDEELAEKGIYVHCVDLEDVYARVSLNFVARLTPHQLKILKPIKDLDSRLRFFKSGNCFAEQLNVGNEVIVQDTDSDSCSRSLPRIDRMEKNGKSFITGRVLGPAVTCAQASSFYSPIPKPLAANSFDCYTASSSFEDTNRRNVIRDVPIRLVCSGNQKQSQCSVKTIRRSGNMDGTKVYAKTLPRSSSGSSQLVNSIFYEDTYMKPSASNVASVSNVSAPVLLAEEGLPIPTTTETVRVDPLSTDIDIKEGDRIVYTDLLSEDFFGTVRWIGRLKGHQQLYAGVEFDKLFGKGTGRYEKSELFCAKKDHAGFLPLTEIRKISEPNSKKTTGEFTSGAKDVPLRAQPLHARNAQQSEPKHCSAEPPRVSSPCRFSDEKGDSLIEQLIPFPPVFLTQGSCVIVRCNGYQRYGVVKWIGQITDSNGFPVESAAVEIDGSLPDKWPNALEKLYGLNGQLMFNSTGEVTLVPVSALYEDNRFNPANKEVLEFRKPNAKKCVEQSHDFCASNVGEHFCMPTTSVMDLVGTMKGIQGCKNSCYLDSTLYAMFVQSTSFDYLLRIKKGTENSLRSRIISALSKDIVSPLRSSHFVSADRISKLRELLQQLLPEMPGLTSDEKDPEELLTVLFEKVFKAEPFLSTRGVNDGKIDDAYICPIITDDVWSNQQKHMVCVQSLLERSLYSSGIQFANEPKILIIQLPRYGKEKVFCKVVPQQELDVTHLIYNMRRPCVICNKQAELTCPECFLTKELLLSEVTYCSACYKKAHAGFDHQHQLIKSDKNQQSLIKSHESSIEKHKLQLSAVLSIETSHYVAFVRVPSVNKWLLFDSMADRVGLENGYNVPKVKSCDRVAQWLSEPGVAKLRDLFEKEHQLPYEIQNDPDVMRLISDCYICFYSSSPSSR